ncbi:helix-turn-helix transcriptional regulator [Natronolimnobius sp. AArcel1]|uniref:ArsR/SmtB family transcription factor n=1 Tax=Natronolimnobius sp. AArcel1 TaxID=1679093 RepID=UPI0013EB2BE5|nr:metalloregulator ArsR/SmtB family transcription factor [Natronolimnobius sp. AArcel1]NGM68077.1 helix-turn-helix transcriptional regulator [Natronolimnobius sp. AArcel1]
MTKDTNMPDTLEDACQTLEQLYDEADSDPIAGLAERRPADDAVGTQATVFGALANEHRVRLLEALRDGELCACELQVVLEAPQSTVATHLRTLREVGLVKTRKKGKWTYYRVADTAVFELLDIAVAVDVPTDS